jgi:hypothetical protein
MMNNRRWLLLLFCTVPALVAVDRCGFFIHDLGTDYAPEQVRFHNGKIFSDTGDGILVADFQQSAPNGVGNLFHLTDSSFPLTRGFDVEDRRLYVQQKQSANGAARAAIYDVTTPLAPTLLGTQTWQEAQHIAVRGQRIYAADLAANSQTTDVEVYDAASPTSIQSAGTITLPGNEISGVAVDDSHAYVLVSRHDPATGCSPCAPPTLHIVSTTPGFALESSLPLPDGAVNDLAIADRGVYIAHDAGVMVVDARQPANPTIVSQVASISALYLAARPLGRLVPVVDQNTAPATTKIVDVTRPDAPQIVASFFPSVGVTSDVDVYSDDLFAAEKFQTSNQSSALSLSLLSEPTDSAGNPNAPDFDELWTKVIEPRCSGCHNPGHQYLVMSDIDTAYTNLTTTLASSPACAGRPYVKNSNPYKSLIFQKTKTHELCGPSMPRNRPPLPLAEMSVLEQWIRGGAKR